MRFIAIALLLLVPSPGWAQTLQPFDDLALRINLDDRLQVEDQSGAKASGRLTSLTRSDLAIRTESGEKRFARDSVRSVAVRGHALRKGTLIGAGVFAVLGAVAVCAHRGGGDCAIVGPLGAAPIGAGVGLAFAALIPAMTPVYSASENLAPARTAPEVTVGTDSLLDDLALHVNLGDRLRVEGSSEGRVTGRLTRLTADEMTLRTDAGDKHFTRETIRQVAVRHNLLRIAVLAGAGAGAAAGAVAACKGPEREECPDAPILAGALGAGLGLVVGSLVHRTTVVFPETEKQTSVFPQISRGAVGVRVSRRW